jgi:hypothetical protein
MPARWMRSRKTSWMKWWPGWPRCSSELGTEELSPSGGSADHPIIASFRAVVALPTDSRSLTGSQALVVDQPPIFAALAATLARSFSTSTTKRE